MEAQQGDAEGQQKEEASKRHTYPLIRVSFIPTFWLKKRVFRNCLFLAVLFQQSDMHDEMKTEVMELCVTACEKFASNNEVSLLWSSKCPDQKFRVLKERVSSRARLV